MSHRLSRKMGTAEAVWKSGREFRFVWTGHRMWVIRLFLSMGNLNTDRANSDTG